MIGIDLFRCRHIVIGALCLLCPQLIAQKSPWAKSVVEMELVLEGPTTIYGVVPGEKINFDVIITTKKSRTFSLKNGTLGTKRLTVTAKNMVVNMDDFTLLPEVDGKKIRGGSYEVALFYGKRKRQKKVTRSLQPDFRALYGPKPEEVDYLNFSFADNPDERFLIPGRATKLKLALTDKNGQEYLNDGSFPRLPAALYQVETKHATWDHGNGVLLPKSEKHQLKNAQYEVSVQFKDLPNTRVTKTYMPDFAYHEGPQPKDVETIGIEVTEGLTGAGRIIPGSALKTSVWARDTWGRSFYSSGDHTYRLPKNRFRLNAKHMQQSGIDGWRASDDFNAMKTTNYSFHINYSGRDDLNHVHKVEPDFLAALQLFFPPTNDFVIRGSSGRVGSAGRSGTTGQTGSTNNNMYGSGGHGSRGSDGGNGQHGGNGRSGPNLVIKAMEVASIGLEGRRFLLVEITGGSKSIPIFLHDPQDGAINISAAGGDGGAGGAGGSGGSGGMGGTAYHPGSGGDGARGGNGGDGGSGGTGGSVMLKLAGRDLESHFYLSAPGGRGGSGGQAGSAGAAGSAGRHHDYHSKTEGRPAPPEVRQGNSGQYGAGGQDGRYGQDGQTGRTQVQSLAANEKKSLWNRAPKELTRQLKQIR